MNEEITNQNENLNAESFDEKLEQISNPKELEDFASKIEFAPDKEAETPKTDNVEDAPKTDKEIQEEIKSEIPEELLNKLNLDKFKGKQLEDILISYKELESKMGEKQKEPIPQPIENIQLSDDIEEKLREVTAQRLRQKGVEYPANEDEYNDMVLTNPYKLKKLDKAFDREFPQVVKEFQERMAYYEKIDDIKKNYPTINRNNLDMALTNISELTNEIGVKFKDEKGEFVSDALNKYIEPLLGEMVNGQPKLSNDVYDFYNDNNQTIAVINPEKLRMKFIVTYGKQIIDLVKKSAIENGRKEGFEGLVNPNKITTLSSNSNRGQTPKVTDIIDPENVFDPKEITKLLEKEQAKIFN